MLRPRLRVRELMGAGRHFLRLLLRMLSYSIALFALQWS